MNLFNALKLKSVFIVIVFSFAVQIFAPAIGSPGSKEEFVITASPLGDILQASEVLAGEELLLKSAPTIGETLSGELGVNSTYFGPGASRPVIRGLQGSRVKMLTNSVSTLDVADVSPDHAVAVEPLLADQVEIIRGPASLLYGSQAAGGVVNVTDNRIPKSPTEKVISGAVEVRGDTAAEERTIVGRLDGTLGSIGYHLDAFTRETENIEIAGFATADPAERPDEEVEGELANSYSESDGLAFGLSWVGEQGYLGASVSQLNQTYGLPGPEEEEEGGVPEPEIFEGPFLDMEQTRVDVSGEYRIADHFFEQLRFAVGVNDYEHNEIEPSGEVATEFRNEAWQARVEAVHARLAGWQGAFGIQLDDRDFSAVGEEAFINPSTTEGWGLYIVEERPADWGVISLGARVEDLENTNEVLADFDEMAWSLAAGVAVNVPAESEVFVNLSWTQRNPSIEELYSRDEAPHLATRQFEIGLLAENGIGVAELEESTNLDIGWRRETGDIRWEVLGFYYDIGDYVYQNLIGEADGLPVAQYTQQDAEFYGFEAAVTVPMWQTDEFTNDIRVFADYVRAELDNGDDLPRIPPWRIGANIDFGQGPWLTVLDVIYHAEQDDISSFNTDDYTMLDLSFLYALEWAQLDWQLFARGTNLLDEEARKSTSFLAAFAPLPGRSFHLGLRVNF